MKSYHFTPMHCTECGWLIADVGQTLCTACWIRSRAVTEVPAMKIGAEIYIAGAHGANGILKRKESGSYCLRKIGQNDHCRFGTLKQIRADVAHFVMCGTLPISGPRW